MSMGPPAGGYCGWDRPGCQLMDHPCQDRTVWTVLREMAGMAFREVLVTEVKEVLRAWLAGLGKRPAAARGGEREDGGPVYPGRPGSGAGGTR